MTSLWSSLAESLAARKIVARRVKVSVDVDQHING
jgi:hypothetical protein